MRSHTAHRFLSLISFLALALVLALPAEAKPAKGQKKGKRSLGTVSAFDAETVMLSVEFRDGSMFEGALADDVKIKLEHRGGKRAERGNPTRGSLEDIDVGDKVLKLKVRAGEVRKLKLRDVDSDVADANGGECKDEPASDAEGEEPLDEGSGVEEPMGEGSGVSIFTGDACADKAAQGDEPDDSPGEDDGSEVDPEEGETPVE